jgi:hypothetical protein
LFHQSKWESSLAGEAASSEKQRDAPRKEIQVTMEGIGNFMRMPVDVSSFYGKIHEVLTGS